MKMKLLSRCRIIMKQITGVYLAKIEDNKVPARQYMSIITKKPQMFRNNRLLYLPCLYSDNKKQFFELEEKAKVFKEVLHHRKERLKDTEHRIRLKGEKLIQDIRHQKEVTGQILREKKEHIVKDILETKAKVKERIEAEVCNKITALCWLLL